MLWKWYFTKSAKLNETYIAYQIKVRRWKNHLKRYVTSSEIEAVIESPQEKPRARCVYSGVLSNF